MRYWWVNQNQTYKHEVEGGFLWSPKANPDGCRNRFYDNMTEVSPGDLVLSFRDTEIKAIGIASGSAVSAEKPNFGNVGDQWENEGWFVPVEFEEVEDPVRPKDFIHELRPLFLGKIDPLQANGNGNQGVYLAEVSQPFMETVLDKMGRSIPDFVGSNPAREEVAEGQLSKRCKAALTSGKDRSTNWSRPPRPRNFQSQCPPEREAMPRHGNNDPMSPHCQPHQALGKSPDHEKLDGCTASSCHHTSTGYSIGD